MNAPINVNVAGLSGIALQGYDPVSCLTGSGPRLGNPAIRATHEGATYLFLSKEHRRHFEAAPEKYVPQFGGYCAYGVASNVLFPVDMATTQVREGKIYLNFSEDVLKLFNADAEQLIERATENWPAIAGSALVCPS